MNDFLEQNLCHHEVTIKCIEDVSMDDNKVDGNVPTAGDSIQINKIHQVKSHISNLKCAWSLSEAALWFSNSMKDGFSDNAEENWLDCDDQAKEHDLIKKERKEVEQLKNNIELVEHELEEESKNIQFANEQAEEKKLRNQERFSIVKNKMERLEKLREKKAQLQKEKDNYLCKMQLQPSDSTDVKATLTEKVERVNMAVDQCLAAVENLRQTNTLFQPECEKSESKMRELEEKINYFKSVNSSDQQKRKEFVYRTVSSFGIRVINVGDTWLEYEISDFNENDLLPMSTMSFTVHFSKDRTSVDRIASNSPTSFMQDLINNVNTIDELKAFNFEVQKRLHNRVMLSKEIESLQENFAIDWDEDHQKVKVMFGRAGQVICTLHIDGEYPTDGYIRVEEIRGADASVIFMDHVVTSELKTLSSWINYLNVKYGNM